MTNKPTMNYRRTRQLPNPTIINTVTIVLLLIATYHHPCYSFAIPPPSSLTTPISTRVGAGAADDDGTVVTTQNPPVSKVAVAGATGNTGRLVVAELLRRNVEVVGLVRDLKKADDVFPDKSPSLTIVKCDLAFEKDVSSALTGCDSAIWCATGFSNDPGNSLFNKLRGIFGAAFPRVSIDQIGIPAMAACLMGGEDGVTTTTPKFVMLSSAGVTRPSWSEEKKEKYKGAAEIPIVRLNPFGILDAKVASEEKLRQSGVEYCIVRPCGLNDNWPANSRPVFSQGDVGVGRINRQDVAKLLVDVLTSPEATYKTFEVITLCDYPPPIDLSVPLSRLHRDGDVVSEEELAATYAVMQQLLPGEKQDAAALAMGQTYEQLDRGEVGRLGKKGEEDAEAVAPKPSS